MGRVNDQVGQGTIWIKIGHIDCCMTNPILKSGEVARKFQCAGCAHRVPDEALGVVEECPIGAGKGLPKRGAFLRITLAGTGGVGADNVDLIGAKTGAEKGQFHAFLLPLGVGKDKVGGVGIDRIADQFAVDLCAAA